MRKKVRKQNGLVVNAIAGGHVVCLGWDLPEAFIRDKGVLGFGIRRKRDSDGEVIWLLGSKTFASVVPAPTPGLGTSTRYHPIQGFSWSDYTASPDETYTYRVAALVGPVAKPAIATYVDVTVTTESIDQGRHAVFFNRGAVASQEYARRFLNKRPKDVGQAAYDWLSRGLVEGLLNYIGSAGAGDALHGAFYEFKNVAVMQALLAAKTRGATVVIVYDDKDQVGKNSKAITDAGADGFVSPRAKSGNLMHNKFIVLSRAGVPAEVWTGSTNLTENGIFGHSNNAHIVRDPEVAAAYLTYWKLLKADTRRADLTPTTETLTPAPIAIGATDTAVVFSPRKNLTALEWYATLVGEAKRAVFMTFAFGMDEKFVPAFGTENDVLHYALMDKAGSGSKKAEQTATVQRIRNLRNTVVSIGAFIPVNGFDRWLEETPQATASHNVLYVHTKYMMVDPLGPDPIVVVGSANFSDPSTKTNDENMLVIRGNTAVADIYFGEYMRLFSHYTFREFANRGPVPGAGRLDENLDWLNRGYFRKGSRHYLQRLYFSGQ